MMNTIARLLLCALGALASVGCGRDSPPDPAPATNSKFAPGQVWQYTCRSGEERSRLVVGKVEQLGKLGTVVHIKLTGLKIKNPHAPGGVSEVMSHAPIAEANLQASVTTMLDERGNLDGFQEGYDTWFASYKNGKAGVFTIPVAEIVGCMEKAFEQ